METGGEKEKRSPTPEEDEEILKKRISGHPLFGLLIENHLGCLKVSLFHFISIFKYCSSSFFFLFFPFVVKLIPSQGEKVSVHEQF